MQDKSCEEVLGNACRKLGGSQGHDHPVCLAEVGHVHGLAGRKEEGQAILHRLTQVAAHRYVSPHLHAVVLLGLGDTEHAMNSLFAVHEERGAYLIFLTTEPLYEPLRASPRFSELVE